MIDIQVQEVLDILNSQLHGRVDYSLFSQIFDEVAGIGVPQGYKLVPVEPTKAMQQSAFDVYEVCDYKNYHLNSGTEVRDMIYKTMIGVVE